MLSTILKSKTCPNSVQRRFGQVFDREFAYVANESETISAAYLQAQYNAPSNFTFCKSFAENARAVTARIGDWIAGLGTGKNIITRYLKDTTINNTCFINCSIDGA
jgi:hypothetical protein